MSDDLREYLSLLLTDTISLSMVMPVDDNGTGLTINL